MYYRYNAVPLYSFSCTLPKGYSKDNTTTPFGVKNGKFLTTFDSCKVYKDFNASLGQTIGCPNGWTFQTAPRESSIITEVGNF